MKFTLSIIAILLGLAAADVSHLSNTYLPPAQPQPQYLPPVPQPEYIPPAPQPEYHPPSQPEQQYLPPQPQYHAPPPPPQPQYFPPAVPQQIYLPPQQHFDAPPAMQYFTPAQSAPEYTPSYDAPPAHELAEDGYRYKTVRKYRFRSH